ncbi:MAG: dihydrodipicolinate synthase family protein [Candidatus Aminicenantes bacterium]|nr:dihydrodipicolinate synthase family protein [Candidatus Aminicenantes bacterium]
MGKRFEGIFPALLTPFLGGAEGGEVDYPGFRENISKYNAFDLAGYVIGGSNGECVLVSNDETAQLVETAKSVAAPGRLVIAGTAQESTRLTIDFTKRLAGCGADAALIRPPSYYKARMNREALRRHFLAVADASPIPVIVYNIPQNTGITIEPGLVVELAGHPRIAGLKESLGSLAYLGEIIRQLPENFSYLTGSGFVVLPALLAGASGAILAVANAAPGLCLEIYRLFREGKIEEAQRRQLDLIPLNKAAMETYGIPGLKYAMDVQGFRGGAVRLPLLPIDEKGKSEIRTLIEGQVHYSPIIDEDKKR